MRKLAKTNTLLLLPNLSTITKGMILCMVLTLTGCLPEGQESNQDQTSFTLNGKVNSDYAGFVYLNYGDTKDSTQVVDSTFSFTGKLNEPVQGYLNLAPSSTVTWIYLENSEIDIEFDHDTQDSGEERWNVLSNPVIKGSTSQDILDGYRALYRSLKNEPSRSDSLYRYLTQVISTVPADPVIGTLLATASISNNPVFDYAQVAALYDQLDTNRISAEDHELLKTGLAGLQAYQAGDHFPDFTIEDENAVLQRISNFKGKYVYVDFWASWCGPCRKKHPALAEFAQQYRGDNFEVVSISIDEDREKWLVATREDELTWVSLFDQAAAYTKELKIVAIPVSYLLDQEGKILRKNVAVADLPSLIAK